MIPIQENRLNRAVQEINKRFGLTTKDGRYRNRLPASHVRAIARRMNEMRSRGCSWHSSLCAATHEQKGLGPQRKALARKAISLYGWWTRKALMKAGESLSELYGGKLKAGDDVIIRKTVNAVTGQMSFLT